MVRAKHLVVCGVQVARIARQLHKYERSLPPNTATPPLRDSVTEWQAVVPVVGALRNQHLKDRHWDRINSLLTKHFDKTAGTTLSNVLGMQVRARACGRVQACRAAQSLSRACQDASVSTKSRDGSTYSNSSTIVPHAFLRGNICHGTAHPSHVYHLHVYLLCITMRQQVMEHSDALIALSNEATQEAALEALLGKVLSRWAACVPAQRLVPTREAECTARWTAMNCCHNIHSNGLDAVWGC
jgi:hypothetical protein